VPAFGSGLIVTTLAAFAVPQLLVTVYDIVAVPWATPVTTPAASTVAISVASLLQAPPIAALVSAVADPAQTVAVPAMVPALGSGLTVTTVVETALPQLLLAVNDIVAVPEATPVTTPLVFTVAVAGEDELHEPSPTEAARVSVTVVPAHIGDVPLIAPAMGNGLTVIVRVAFAVPQLLVTVYVILALPWAIPVTTPVVLTVAIPVALELHTPPVAASV